MWVLMEMREAQIWGFCGIGCGHKPGSGTERIRQFDVCADVAEDVELREVGSGEAAGHVRAR